MKAYINENDVVTAIGLNDSLFPNCEIVEITEEEKLFIEACKLPKRIDGVFVEGFSEEYERELNLQKAMQIDLEYKDRITKLLNIPMQKLICEELDSIPLDILAEKERLKTECNEKIIALGITDFSFRKKVTINLKE